MWGVWEKLATGGAVWIVVSIVILLFPSLPLLFLAFRCGGFQFFRDDFFRLVAFVGVFVVLVALHEWWKEWQERRKLARLLSSQEPYRAAFQQGGPEMVLTLAFCELFIANCLEVRYAKVTAEPQREYRIRDDVDIDLLHPVERMVAKRLSTYCSYGSLQSSASGEFSWVGVLSCSGDFSHGEGASFGSDKGHREAARVAECYQKIIADALALNPPLGCGV